MQNLSLKGNFPGEVLRCVVQTLWVEYSWVMTLLLMSALASLPSRMSGLGREWCTVSQKLSHFKNHLIIKMEDVLWLLWFSGLSVLPQTKRSPVQFLVRAHAWVVGSVLVGGVQEATNLCFSCTLMFLSLSFSLPSPLSKNK